MSRRFLQLVLGIMVLAAPCATADAPPSPPATQFRRPVALVLADDGKLLLVANQRSGSISVLDTAGLRVLGEANVGRRLADLAATPDGRLVAVDETVGELLVLTRRGAQVEVSRRVQIGPTPVSVQVAADGTRAFVASLWSRRISVVDLGKADEEPRVSRTIALPFPPRRQLVLPDGSRLVVADAFGGRVAVVDPGAGTVESVRTLPGHNLRGLTLRPDGRELLVTHQVLNPLAHTTFDDVHWGNVMTNNLRVLAVADLLTPDADLLRGGRLLQLGVVGHGSGDPAGVAVAADGTTVVTLAGTSEVAVGPAPDGTWRRLPVGRRPTAVVLSPDGRRAYVANTFADSVSVVDLPDRVREVALGPQPEPGPADRGEMFFYDARLAHDGWLSCHSCHTDGHSNGLLNDNLGDGSFGAPKRVLSLLGVKDTGPWAWNGGMPRLEDQVRKSIRTTMHGRPTDEQIASLTAYLQTLPPPPAAPADGPAGARERGRQVFQAQGCAACHAPPTYTSAKTYDVGLADEVGNTHFNPPSLRGVGQGGPFFHDNRAPDLEAVFVRYRHQLKQGLEKDELEDLLTFLRSL